MMWRKLILTAALVAAAVPALAQSQQGTPQERTACAPAVRKFCKSANEDSMRVLACLQANRAKIGAACNKVLVSHGQ
jgi:hypothetical protein